MNIFILLFKEPVQAEEVTLGPLGSGMGVKAHRYKAR